MRESDIVYESGMFWIGHAQGSVTVYRAGATHSIPDSSSPPTESGLSLARARCDYLARRYTGDNRGAVAIATVGRINRA